MNYLDQIDRKEAYEILGLKENATENEIKAAYKHLSTLCHPDKGGTNQLFYIIKTAKELLLKPEKKSNNENKQKTTHKYGDNGEDLSKKWQNNKQEKKPSWLDIISEKDFIIPIQNMLEMMQTNEKQKIIYKNYKVDITPEDIILYNLKTQGEIETTLTTYPNLICKWLEIFPKEKRKVNIKVANSKLYPKYLDSRINFELKKGYYVLSYIIGNKLITLNFKLSKRKKFIKINKKFEIIGSPNNVKYNISLQAHTRI